MTAVRLSGDTVIEAPLDLAGYRLTNAGDAIEGQDYVTRRQVETWLRGMQPPGPSARHTKLTSTTGIRVGTYAERGGAILHAFELFFASDRNYVGWVSDGTVWKYTSGVQYGTLSPDQRPTLTSDDTGYRFRSTDFNREYRWSGAAWADAPGSPARFGITHCSAAPEPADGWQLCDGSTVSRSTSTGTTTNITVPDLCTNNRFLRSVGSSPGGTGGNAAAHTHPVDPGSTTSSTPNSTTVVQSGTGVTVASATHTHTTDPVQFNSSTPSGTGGDDGLPYYYNALPYMRL